jgi:hypothetical protein
MNAWDIYLLQDILDFFLPAIVMFIISARILAKVQTPYGFNASYTVSMLVDGVRTRRAVAQARPLRYVSGTRELSQKEQRTKGRETP